METVDSEIGDPSKESLKQILWKSCSSTCSNTDDNLHIPQVKQECKPRLGQEFASLDDVYNFYNKYAKEAGFSVRINSSRKNRENNEIVRKEYVCFKEGISVKAKGVVSETKRRRGITREGCNAKLAVVKSKAGTYTVSIFVEGHSHALAAPQRVHLLRSHRKESEGKKSVSRQLSAPNVSKHQEITEKKSEGVCESREIVYQKDLDLASCSCKNFEIEGIPCRHILSYLNRMQITCLPNQYIMKRWTKAAKSAGNVDDDGLEMNDYSDKSFFVRRTRLFQLASTVIDKVAFSDEVSKILEEALDYVLHKIKSVVGYGGLLPPLAAHGKETTGDEAVTRKNHLV
ncbi:hypothetical protein JRO89_XS06G0238400 [Xanthoceras sorbifolium]|uniref:Protein FAR1-RELATED SEQUENCE n=1 Tax=Xanthoceras sorbifolium TaxID=99658 RepID=A0ABQ8HZ74_9ROSI|nr:hypothetical protein JRO89_XS06G0238400 [Xanthoceras sorbifolium]